MVQKLESLKNARDTELLACVAEARGHTGNDFQSYFGTDYSYSCIVNELQSRGYVNGWHKEEEPVKEIKIKMSKGGNERMNLNMTKECKKRFEKFLSNQPYNFVHVTAALTNYLDELENNEVKVTLEVM